MTTSNLSSTFRHLQRKYAGELPARLNEITLTWKSVREGGDAKVRKLLHRQLHTLAGSGATFGYPELGKTAAAICGRLQKNEPAFERLERDEMMTTDALMVQLAQDAQHYSEPPDLLAELTPRDTPEPAATSKASNRMVFLFEDDTILANEIAQQISHFGYDIQIYANPALLEQALANSRPVAILMDIVFEQDDLAGVNAIRALDPASLADIPVLFLSVRSDLQARLEAVRSGAKAYFVKPIEVSAIVERLDSLTAGNAHKPLHILIVDDTQSDAIFNATVLRSAGMITRVVTDPADFLQNLSDFRPELILLDMYMPDCTGEELASVVRQHDEYVSIPIVFLSGETDRGKQLQAMRIGGEDFLIKPIRPDHLIAVVEIHAERYRVLRSFMERDSLTGLLNHTKINTELEKELSRAKRRGAPLSFVMLDLDKFKLVNDTYGHPTGDRVIRALARILKQRLRRSDIIGRYGGEEFAVVLTDTDPDTAFQVMDSVRKAFAQVLHRAEQTEISVTFSAGIASYPALMSAVELSNAADKALYAAKHAGNNQVIRFDAALHNLPNGATAPLK